MTTTQLADELDLPEKKVVALITSGALKADKLAGVWAVNTESLKALKRRQQPGPGLPGLKKDS